MDTPILKINNFHIKKETYSNLIPINYRPETFPCYICNKELIVTDTYYNVRYIATIDDNPYWKQSWNRPVCSEECANFLIFQKIG